jgi:hypothetical protein
VTGQTTGRPRSQASVVPFVAGRRWATIDRLLGDNELTRHVSTSRLGRVDSREWTCPPRHANRVDRTAVRPISRKASTTISEVRVLAAPRLEASGEF